MASASAATAPAVSTAYQVWSWWCRASWPAAATPIETPATSPSAPAAVLSEKPETRIEAGTDAAITESMPGGTRTSASEEQATMTKAVCHVGQIQKGRKPAA